MGWGGARPGAGRKDAPIYTRTISLCVKEETAEAYKAIRKAGVDVRGAFEKMVQELKGQLSGREKNNIFLK